MAEPGEIDLSDLPSGVEHEEVGASYRRRSGLKAIVAIHSTRLGPSLGGTRYRQYGNVREALLDVLALSRAMSYKAAVAGLDQGGGKAVIIGDPAKDKSKALLEDYAELIESLGGRYYTAEDIGTTQADMDEIARHTSYVTGRSLEAGGSGDPSPATAYGVYRAMEATCGALFGEPSLEGRTVAISGVGKVGRVLAELLRDALSTVIVADVDPLAVAGAVEELGAVAAPVEEIHRVRCDIYAPCALGGALDDRSVPELACAAVVGAANNQLAHPGIAELLRARSIAYVPDYVANAGGIINISHERGGYDKDRAHAHVGSIYDTVAALFSEASRSGETLETVAAKLAEERLGQPTP